jgi:hypothetical protein
VGRNGVRSAVRTGGRQGAWGVGSRSSRSLCRGGAAPHYLPPDRTGRRCPTLDWRSRADYPNYSNYSIGCA